MIDKAVEEVRRRRRQLLKERYGGSVGNLIKEAQRWQRKHPDQVVDLRKASLARA